MKKIFITLFFVVFICFSYNQAAKEILIYADSITYDKEKNIIAKGNAKIISDKQIIISDLIIYKKIDEKYILPMEFSFKDEKNNFYNGTSGEFSKNLNKAKIIDTKILLSDGSRIVGKELIRDGEIDIITKGSFSPCTSRINIKKFKCPIWQVEDEKMLHDRKNLFLYHKHSKIRIFNIPVGYIPYLVTPSPLRKKRKSGFLNPSISFNFIDAQTTQTVKFPYYFNLAIDKELYFTPTINYGGGVDSSQRLKFNYEQLTSGGEFTTDINIDTKLENSNNETWLQDASIITNYNNNINENFTVNIKSAFQSSPTYLRQTDKKNILNRDVSLITSLNLSGYDLKKIDDRLNFKISSYQVVKKNDDNSTLPTAIPYISYGSGYNKYKNIDFKNRYSFYNIIRDNSTSDLAQRQQKINYNFISNYEFYKIKSKINFKTELLSQFYHIEKKQINDINYIGYYKRIFPMTGLYMETPIRNKKYKLGIIPKLSLILNGLQPSSNRVSNEESINSSYSLLNNKDLNRYVGSDKLDNSQRINYSLDFIKENLIGKISQSYEFNENSNYNKDIGLKDNLSDVLFNSSYKKNKLNISYDNRINVDIGEIKNQSLTINFLDNIGEYKFSYNQKRVEENSVLKADKESINLSFNSLKMKKFNTFSLSTNYDLIKDYATNYKLGYEYIDECFGIDLSFQRFAYEDRIIKPEDTLSLMFSFKYLGSYKSTNLAVSETDKQDIQWESSDTDNTKFYILND